MDHGVLNVPLAKRGDIDAQLDAYKREQAALEAREAKAKAVQFKADKAQAKELLAVHQDAILARHGAKFGIRKLRTTLDQWAKWEPKKLIAFVAKFQAEAA
jgi:hypothetical protein